MQVLDLFCGCGGFSVGFEQEGIEVLGIDMWDVCLKSHGGRTILHDIRTLTKGDLPLDFQNPDIVIGSPPCQTFSNANRHTRTKDDSLIKEFMRIVHELQPKFWVWENVLGSQSVQKGTILDAQHFGVAQRRKRNFVSNFDLTDMSAYHHEPVTVRHTLTQIKGSGLLDGYNSKVYSLDGVSPTIRRIPLKWYDGRYDQDGLPKRLRFTGFEMLTVSDHIKLMGFADGYQLIGNKTQQMLQIGNCVSPVVSRAIAKKILKLW